MRKALQFKPGEILAPSKFTFIKDVEMGKKRKCLVKCFCGKTTVIALTNIRTGHTTSCGCAFEGINKTHGESYKDKTPEYYTWALMKQRCRNPKNPRYKDYGARGIKVCSRWEKYENFVSDMGRRPSKEYSIDRINNNGDYTPENCRWATRVEQANNKRAKRLVKLVQ